MTKFEAVLNLPIDDLKKRRDILEEEYNKVDSYLTLNSLRKSLLEIDAYGVKIESVSWDFYPENDDEGGSIYYPSDLSIDTDSDLDPEEIEIVEKTSYGEYTYTLYDIVSEIVIEHSSGLYEQNIYEIELDREGD